MTDKRPVSMMLLILIGDYIGNFLTIFVIKRTSLKAIISVAIQRGNAASVLGTVDTVADKMDSIFYL